MQKPLFIAVLEDNTIYTGGTTYEKALWLALPKNKKIKRLFYTLPDGNHLCLDMYDKYFLGFESTIDINGKNVGKNKVAYIYLIGEKEERITCYKINPKSGNIERIEYAKNDTFITGLSKDGWR